MLCGSEWHGSPSDHHNLSASDSISRLRSRSER